jgi:hypothetical protein
MVESATVCLLHVPQGHCLDCCREGGVGILWAYPHHRCPGLDMHYHCLDCLWTSCSSQLRPGKQGACGIYQRVPCLLFAALLYMHLGDAYASASLGSISVLTLVQNICAKTYTKLSLSCIVPTVSKLQSVF